MINNFGILFSFTLFFLVEKYQFDVYLFRWMYRKMEEKGKFWVLLVYFDARIRFFIL